MVALSLRNVGASYGSRLTIQEITTPVMRAGELIAVIGPNAAGKSTLFKRIAGILRGPGEVVVEDARSRHLFGYMPQDSSANAVLTVYESILIARKQGQSWSVEPSDLALVDELLLALGIRNLAFRDLGALSGGQRQLVAIAQTLAREPAIMLMDEPTSALDLHRQVEVLELMRSRAQSTNMLVLIAIHDLNQALRFADQVMVIADGRLRGCGEPREVINPLMLREVYKVDARVERCSKDHAHVIVDGRVH